MSRPTQSADEGILLREAHHRMMNTLTLLMALLRRDLASATISDALTRHEERTMAFAELHRLLALGAGKGEVAAEAYLGQLCRLLVRALLKPRGIRCEYTAQHGYLSGASYERLGLVVTELVTNAAKHAFDGRSDAFIRVELIHKRGFWICIVTDNGVGKVAKSNGLGSQILDELILAAGGRLRVYSSSRGTFVTVILPVYIRPAKASGRREIVPLFCFFQYGYAKVTRLFLPLATRIIRNRHLRETKAHGPAE